MNKIKSKLVPWLKENKLYVISALVIFLVFYALISLIPLTGDDWEWGSFLGPTQLKNWFKNYNGRYSGNLLVIVLTRVMFLRNLFTALFYTALCVLPMIFAKKKSVIYMAVPFALILAVPKTIFAQTFAWTSGFCNYIPPVVLTFIYFIMMNWIFEDKLPSYSKQRCITYSIISFLIGFISTMFMENVTIYIVIISVAIIVFTFIKFRKFDKSFIPQLTHLLGSILGTVAMFSNSIYTTLSENGSDGYRELPNTKNNLFQLFIGHIDKGLSDLLPRSYVLLAFVSLICFTATFLAVKRGCSKKTAYVLCTSSTVNLISALLLIARKVVFIWNALGKVITKPGYYMGILAILYCASVIVIACMVIKDKNKIFRMMLPLISVPILIGPMLFITPFPTRCLMPPYLCLIFFVVLLLDAMLEYFDFKGCVGAVLLSSVIAISVAYLIMYLCAYIPMCYWSNERLDYIDKQIDAGYTTVCVPELPNTSYVHIGAFTHIRWITAYKHYFGIDLGIGFRVVSVEEFKVWRDTFDKAHS